MDIERGYDEERKALLPAFDKPKEVPSQLKFSSLHLSSAFVGGIIGCLLFQYTFCHPSTPFYGDIANPQTSIGSVLESTLVEPFPPSSPSNAFPSMFPSDVGYAGGTPTGAEPALIATAPEYPVHTGGAQLVQPLNTKKGKGKKNKEKEWDLFKHWGNLSPWYSNERGTFGLDSDPDAPDTCRVTSLHLLHRHGARYPSEDSFAKRFGEGSKKWKAKNDLAFLNDWHVKFFSLTYKLGENILTPFGRQQMFDLGVSMRLKYGYLLNDFTETKTIPVFRTTSKDRMVHSALNFALGFFGYPFEGQYQQSIVIEEKEFNNTLKPDETCENAKKDSIGKRGEWYVERWTKTYLKKTRKRLQSHLDDYRLSIDDVYAMQQMCAHETVALGYSKFCELFTQEEWEGFDYSYDLEYWYNSAFGSPVGRVLGAGWIQELLARLEHKPIKANQHRFSTNKTLDGNPVTFPVNQSLYVDVTHEEVVLSILTALNLTTLAANGPLPYDHIPKRHSFKGSQLSGFGSNVQIQVLECSSSSLASEEQIRIIINDAPVPLTGIRGCPKQKDGMCPLKTFVKAQREILEETSWEWGCFGDYEGLLGKGPKWESVTGDAPKPKSK
ncbi:hypothetical protein D9757_005881 [Collybiopsis confluens]|uniref:Uncharacterized protein n=1 Tax=Collybiopsis confluens TaxID=2823264 RepID=A0A8H5HNC9_9AGAR|nr:hypothetical protein D9757_005881 [Collybiopsis confluens]